MKNRFSKLLVIALGTALVVAGVAAAVGSVAVYRNNMNTVDKRSDFRKIGAGNCARGGSRAALRVKIGRGTRECVYRSPVVGRDLDISATGRLLSGTPRALRGRMFVALNLRDGEGGQYQLAVYPIRREWKLRKDVPPDGARKTLAKGTAKRIRGVNGANEMRLRIFNLKGTPDRDDARIVAWINGKRFAVVTDDATGPMQGRFSAVALGALKVSRGAVGSFDDVVVRVPDPYSR